MSSSLDGLFWSVTNLKTLIPATILMAAFAVLLRKLIGAKSDRVKNIPFQVMAVALVVLEAVKQWRDLSQGAYSLWSIPLHFSSVYLFLFPLTHFSRGAFAMAMRPATAVAAGMTTIGMLLFPMTVFGDAAGGYFKDFGSFHTVTYHYAIILYFFLFIALGMHEPDTRKDAVATWRLVTVYALVAAPVANAIGVNFMSFLFSSFPPLEAARVILRDALGIVPGQLIYVGIMYLGMLGSATLSTILYRGLNRLVRRIPPGSVAVRGARVVA
ncbi:MAG: hypothetical protein WC509_03635 [Candidatus Izemoplasmatales bacterium]